MNLIKSFNFKYLKENIKKSKGLIALFSILVPIFTMLITILFLNNEIYRQLIEMVEIIWVNMIGLFVIPVAISMALFGYVYKKTSVDLVNSMPLNRKTIFVTNTIGGIAIITIIQVITAILLLLCNILCSNIYIYPEMIFDIFVLMWISYVFVFLATNVAMTLSGTHFTQIVLTMLILFLIPFCHFTLGGYDMGKPYKLVDSAGEVLVHEYTNRSAVNYTMPFHIMSGLTGGYDYSIYSSESIVKMIVLGTIYFFLGLYLFKKRKMENTEESFEHIGIHLLVKALTILPMIILLNLLEPDITFFIIAFTCIAVYYFIYDFIVKKKVRLKISIPAMIMIFVILQVLCVGMIDLDEDENVYKLAPNDVIAVSLDFINNGRRLQYFVGNRDIINYIYELKSNANGYYYYSTYTSSTVEIVDVEAMPKEEIKYNIVVSFKDKNEDIYSFTLNVTDEERNKLISMIETDENYLAEIKKDYMINGKYVISRHMIDDETNELLNKEIEVKLNTLPLKEFIDLTSKSVNYSMPLNKYYYKNHKILNRAVPMDLSEKTLELVGNSQNAFCKMIFEKRKEEPIKDWVEYDIVGGTNYNARNYNDYEYYNMYNIKDEIDKYVYSNLYTEFDATKPYYVFRISNRIYYGCYFFTNDVQKVEEFIAKEKSFRSPEINYYKY